MLNQILANTPRWVWGLLLALLWLGLSQAVTRSTSLELIACHESGTRASVTFPCNT